jgi:hypothetical protein
MQHGSNNGLPTWIYHSLPRGRRRRRSYESWRLEPKRIFNSRFRQRRLPSSGGGEGGWSLAILNAVPADT